MIEKYLSALAKLIAHYRSLGLSDIAIKRRITREWKIKSINNPNTKNWNLIFDFIVNEKQIGNYKFFNDSKDKE